jgi:hypothetical protein
LYKTLAKFVQNKFETLKFLLCPLNEFYDKFRIILTTL